MCKLLFVQDGVCTSWCMYKTVYVQDGVCTRLCIYKEVYVQTRVCTRVRQNVYSECIYNILCTVADRKLLAIHCDKTENKNQT